MWSSSNNFFLWFGNKNYQWGTLKRDEGGPENQGIIFYGLIYSISSFKKYTKNFFLIEST